MPTITIDIPDDVTIPADWDLQSFVLSKMCEAGMVAPNLETPSEEETDDEVDNDPDSWFTLEERKQFKENRRRLEEEWKKNPPKMSKEEFSQAILNLPVADEKAVAYRDEVDKLMGRQWG
jgi:hypothetical protein